MSARPSIELRRAALAYGAVHDTAAANVLSSALHRVLDRYVKTAGEALAAPKTTISPSVAAVLLKPVGDHCNLFCTYCYEGVGADRFSHGRMSEAILTRTIDTALRQAQGPIEFIWHGGEPLLAGIEFFERAMELQRLSKNRTHAVFNSLQTNGLMLDEHWLRFLSQHSFSIGISVDGPQDVHDQYRVDSQRRGTHMRVCEAIQKVRSANLPFGIITVLHPELVCRAPEYLAFVLDQGIRYIDIHPRYGMLGAANPPLASRDFAAFCIALFDAWLESGIEDLRINLFDDFLRGYFFGEPETCYFAGTCSSIVAVEANGDVVPCTRPFDRQLHTFGRIGVASLEKVIQGPLASRFRRWDLESQSTAEQCPWHYLCHNGCPQHRTNDAGEQDVRGASKYCQCTSGEPGGHRAIWTYIAMRLDEIYLKSKVRSTLS